MAKVKEYLAEQGYFDEVAGVFMVHVHRENQYSSLPTLTHGAFKTYRQAANWLLNEGYKPVFDTINTQFEDEDIEYYNTSNGVTLIAEIENYTVLEEINEY